MKILVADYIYTPNGYVEYQAVAFDKQIKAVDSLENLLQTYPEAQIIRTEPHSVIYPGFINTHVHLEFSANKTSLKYGSFMPWLDSVIANRDELMQVCDNKMMMQECDAMLRSGITSFGAISSFGAELEVCQQTPQRVVFFNELIGSNAQYADILYGDFLERLNASQSCNPDQRITPAIAIHSPYSVHPVLLQKAVTLAKQNKLPLSAHFLESQAEREWLESGSGELKTFFEKYFNTSTPVTNIEEFMVAFDTYPTHFTHCVQATKAELKHLSDKGHSIAHCPRSNRYLGCGRLKIEELDLPFSVATDGLSSNDSLSIFDELRAALMLHNDIPIQTLAGQLIKATTADAADILGLNCGKIEADKWADLAVITLPDMPQTKEEIALWSIIHTKEVSEVYIEGIKVTPSFNEEEKV
jgi:cytosine/adenosine deaminase-related metal-dependent hydrolase